MILTKGIIKFACLTVLYGFTSSPSHAQVNSCIAQHVAGEVEGAGPAAQDFESIIDQIGSSIGLARVQQQIQIISCPFISKVQAFYASGQVPDVPEGEYIIVNEDWVREVVGTNRTEAIFLVGHEYGHFLQRHFGARRNLTDKEKELEADQLGACAVARASGAWSEVEYLIARIRREDDELYPTRDESLEISRQGFEDCGGFERVCRLPEHGVERWADEVTVTQESEWMQGGFNPGAYCDQLLGQVSRQYPDADEFEPQPSPERTRDTCEPFNCIQYQYVCTIIVRDEPVYNLGQSDKCP